MGVGGGMRRAHELGARALEVSANDARSMVRVGAAEALVGLWDLRSSGGVQRVEPRCQHGDAQHQRVPRVARAEAGEFGHAP
jgi:hypothetical protein